MRRQRLIELGIKSPSELVKVSINFGHPISLQTAENYWKDKKCGTETFTKIKKIKEKIKCTEQKED